MHEPLDENESKREADVSLICDLWSTYVWIQDHLEVGLCSENVTYLTLAPTSAKMVQAYGSIRDKVNK